MALDLTRPVQTRNGRKARIVSTDMKNEHSVVALVLDDDGTEYAETYRSDGSYSTTRGDTSSLDLINVPEAPKTFVRFINFSPTYGFLTRSEADRAAMSGRIACVRVEFAEGRFDD